MTKFIGILIFVCFISCSQYGQLTYVTKLPKKLKENSGMVVVRESKVWFIADNGNPDKIYEVNLDGQLLKELKVTNAKNGDWEDLSKDDKGNIYIADFGNNANKRKDLVIYKLPNPDIEKGGKINAEKIKFTYPEQKNFPPDKHRLLFDAEALFYSNDYLYIITKNRTRPFTGEALIYKVPSSKGSYKAQYVNTFTPCKEKGTCQVTAADISPDGKKIAVLGYGKLWVFTDFVGEDFTKGKMTTIDLQANTQLESICFTDNETLLLSDEQQGITGRNLYSYSLKK
ncbi:MAG: hypothetical protein AAFO99_13110 [Bacteroidota bacterium]